MPTVVTTIPPEPVVVQPRHRRRMTIADTGVHTLRDIGDAGILHKMGKKLSEMETKTKEILPEILTRHPTTFPNRPGVSAPPDDWSADSLALSGTHAYRQHADDEASQDDDHYHDVNLLLLESMGWPA